jgi:hypothetical protein
MSQCQIGPAVRYDRLAAVEASPLQRKLTQYIE